MIEDCHRLQIKACRIHRGKWIIDGIADGVGGATVADNVDNPHVANCIDIKVGEAGRREDIQIECGALAKRGLARQSEDVGGVDGAECGNGRRGQRDVGKADECVCASYFNIGEFRKSALTRDIEAILKNRKIDAGTVADWGIEGQRDCAPAAQRHHVARACWIGGAERCGWIIERRDHVSACRIPVYCNACGPA